MADTPPPVDWSSVQVKSDLGGISRFPAEAALKPTAWKCPSCGAENVSVFEYGCPVCHAGEPGKHVGVDPITPKRPPVAETGPTLSAAKVALIAWMREQNVQPLDEGVDLAYRAFLAGYEKGKADMIAAAATGGRFRFADEIKNPSAHPPILPVHRAIITTPTLAQTVSAALSAFRDGFLAGLSDEDRALWASNDEINALLSILEQITND